MSKAIRILVVDDHALIREALADRLRKEHDFDVVGKAADAGDAVALVQKTPVDVVLMDIEMPGLDSFEATRRIQAFSPRTRVLFVSAFPHERFVEQVQAVKGHGFVTKMDPPGVLTEAIRAVARGERYYSPVIQKQAAKSVDEVPLQHPGRSRLASLTPRELEILRGIARGHTQKEIAAQLHISVKTVETHCTNLMAKLGLHNRVELARFAIREGIIQP